jgi:hypothetical protein
MTASEPQTPSGEQIFLDHVGWFVPDMDVAHAAFEKLGLPMTPFTVHTNEQADGSRVPSGTANRCAMIRRGYLEVLVSVPDVDTAIARQLRTGLSRYTGLHLVAFTVGDADATVERLQGAGFQPDPPIALRRPMPLDDGGEGTAAFSVIRFPDGAMDEGRIQILTQDTPDIVWQPSVTADENGLDMLSGILLCVADPSEASARYARFVGRRADFSGGVYRIKLDRGLVAICGFDACRELLPGVRIPDLPFMPAVSIRSADIDRTAAYLAGRGVPIDRPDAGRVIVPPEAGMGAAFIFHDGGVPPFGE